MLITLQTLMSRLQTSLRARHPQLVASLGRYVSGKKRFTQRARPTSVDTDPYWVLLPQWLARRAGRAEEVDRRFLSDVLLGQFCAFLAVKIQDDVFDGHVDDGSLIFTADHLLLSARASYEPHFPGRSRLWSFFDASVRRTFDAIVAWDRCQVRGFRSQADVAAMTSAGYAVCNLATFAVCLRTKRTALFRRLVRCTDELAFVGQLVDDLEDLSVDAARGRWNYAARFLSGSLGQNGRSLKSGLARGIIVDGRAERFFDLLQRHLKRASTLADGLRIPELSAHIDEYRRSLERSESVLHRQRVDVLFGAPAR